MLISSFLTHRRLEAHFHRAAWKVCGTTVLLIYALYGLTWVAADALANAMAVL